jgi:predicted ATP-binding protein involved in virulence
MRIRELSISNYRAFGGVKVFEFADRFTVVAGINGRGKTAMLDGLALLFSRLLRSLHLTEGETRTMAVSDVYGQADSATLSMKVNCAGIPLEYEVSYTRGKRRVKTTSVSLALRDQVLRAYGDPNRADDQAPLAVYYTTDRAGFRVPRTLPRKLGSGQTMAYIGALFNRMVDYRDFIARYLVWQSAKASREIDAFNTARNALLEGFGDLEVSENPLRFSVRKGEHSLGLGQLSDGERSFLAVIGDLVRRLSLANPKLKNPLLGAGVVLIDELELHLHPRWQREVRDKLRRTFPNIQFIATTHSPFVIQSLKPGELINLDPEEFGEYSNQSIEDITETVMGVDLPQKSERYKQMMAAAGEYFRLLKRPKAGAREIEMALQRLNELSAPFSDDPAFQALLKLERETEGER